MPSPIGKFIGRGNRGDTKPSAQLGPVATDELKRKIRGIEEAKTLLAASGENNNLMLGSEKLKPPGGVEWLANGIYSILSEKLGQKLKPPNDLFKRNHPFNSYTKNGEFWEIIDPFRLLMLTQQASRGSATTYNPRVKPAYVHRRIQQGKVVQELDILEAAKEGTWDELKPLLEYMTLHILTHPNHAMNFPLQATEEHISERNKDLSPGELAENLKTQQNYFIGRLAVLEMVDMHILEKAMSSWQNRLRSSQDADLSQALQNLRHRAHDFRFFHHKQVFDRMHKVHHTFKPLWELAEAQSLAYLIGASVLQESMHPNDVGVFVENLRANRGMHEKLGAFLSYKPTDPATPASVFHATLYNIFTTTHTREDDLFKKSDFQRFRPSLIHYWHGVKGGLPNTYGELLARSKTLVKASN